MKLEKEQIHNAFMRLGEILRERRVMGEIDVFRGAAIVMGFDFRRATQDVDSLVTKGHGEMMQAAQEVEKELHLPPNWLNEQATIYLSRRRNFHCSRRILQKGSLDYGSWWPSQNTS